MSSLKYLYGTAMSEAEIEEFLIEQGYGHVSLAADGEAYTVPMSFGYDGNNRIFLYFIQFTDEDSHKLEMLHDVRGGRFHIGFRGGRPDPQSPDDPPPQP